MVSVLDAKTHLSRLIEQIVTGAASEIVISRNGTPVARLVPVVADASRRVGVAAGAFEVPDDIDGHNAEIAAMFQKAP